MQNSRHRCLACHEASQMTAIGLARRHHDISSTSQDGDGTSDIEAYPLVLRIEGNPDPAGTQHHVIFQGSPVLHPVEEGIVASKEKSGHVKYDGLKCCAINCKFGVDKPKPMRKDKLTQHIRDVHQGLDAKFQCIIAECPFRDMSIKDLIVHLRDAGLRDDVRFSALVSAAEKPKCACGSGLVVRGECKACGFIYAQALGLGHIAAPDLVSL